MRIRPFFWLLLALSCIGVLIFAARLPEHLHGVMHVHLPRPPALSGPTTVELQLTDEQGLPIEQAQVVSSANMTNMPMAVKQSSVIYLGHGTYATQLRFSMAGPWAITVQAQADGFATLLQTLRVNVIDSRAMTCTLA